MRGLGSVSFLSVVAAAAAAAGLVGLPVVAGAGNASFLYNGAEDAFPVIEYKASNNKNAQIDPKHPDFVLIEYNGPHVIEFYSPMYVPYISMPSRELIMLIRVGYLI
jgi:hypothetical protein